ncbi:MAG: HEAT repeat domain-containing protein [Armatimonadetes bacterium]|jgi:hypothetical protein|nr:HEAT repeat domain-containing protein [Armatimonadota bacterium]
MRGFGWSFLAWARALLLRMPPGPERDAAIASSVAAVALGHHGDPRAAAPLLDALSHELADVRFAVVSALGRLGAPASGALPHLRRLAQHDPDRRVQSAAARASGRIEEAVRRGSAELVAAETPQGRGTELGASLAPAGRGTEPEADPTDWCS